MIRKESKHSAGMGSRFQGGNLEKLISEILKFRDKRDWAQFHDPKNLAEAID